MKIHGIRVLSNSYCALNANGYWEKNPTKSILKSLIILSCVIAVQSNAIVNDLTVFFVLL